MAITINGSGTITGISAGGLPDGCVDNDTLASSSVTVNGTAISLGGSENITAGKVLQVVTSNVTTIQSVTSQSYTNVSAMNLSITPSSTSSKIMVMYNLTGCTTGNAYCAATIYRGGTNLMPTGSGTGYDGMFWIEDYNTSYADYRARTTSFAYIDSPSTTSAVTYYLYVRPQKDSGHYFTLNQARTRGDSNQLRQGVSTVTLMEIAG